MTKNLCNTSDSSITTPLVQDIAAVTSALCDSSSSGSGIKPATVIGISVAASVVVLVVCYLARPDVDSLLSKALQKVSGPTGEVLRLIVTFVSGVALGVLFVPVYGAAIVTLYEVTMEGALQEWAQRWKERNRERQDRTALIAAWRNARRQWADEELKWVRREKVPLMSQCVGDRYTTDLERNHDPNRQCGFYTLPGEVRLQVYSYLDYGQALILEQSSRYFYNDRPTAGVDKEQKATFVFHAETFTCNTSKDRMACYACLRVLSRAKFMIEQCTGEHVRFGVLDVERICFECQLGKDVDGRWSKLWRFRVARALQRMLRKRK